MFASALEFIPAPPGKYQNRLISILRTYHSPCGFDTDSAEHAFLHYANHIISCGNSPVSQPQDPPGFCLDLGFLGDHLTPQHHPLSLVHRRICLLAGRNVQPSDSTLLPVGPLSLLLCPRDPV